MSDFDHHMELMAAELEMHGRPRTSPGRTPPPASSPVIGGPIGGNVMDFFKKQSAPPAAAGKKGGGKDGGAAPPGEKDTRSRREKRKELLDRYHSAGKGQDEVVDEFSSSSDDGYQGGKGKKPSRKNKNSDSPEPHANAKRASAGKPDKASIVRTPEHTVHLKDLPFHCTRRELRAALDQFGQVEKVRVCEPKGSITHDSNVRNCYGFVQFSEIRSAERMKEVAPPHLPQDAIPSDLPFRANPAKHVINDVHHSQDYNPNEIGSLSRFGHPKRDNKYLEVLLPKKAAEMEEFLRHEREKNGGGSGSPPHPPSSMKDLPSLPGTSSSAAAAPSSTMNQSGGGITLLERFRQGQSQDRTADSGPDGGINNRSLGGDDQLSGDLLPLSGEPEEFTNASSLLIDVVEKVSAWFGIEQYAKDNKGAEPSSPSPAGDRQTIITAVPAILKRITNALAERLEAEVNIFNQVLEGQADEESGEDTIDLSVNDIVDFMNLTEIELSQAVVATVASAAKINKEYLSQLSSNGGDVVAAQQAAPRDRRLLRSHTENVLAIIRDRVRLLTDYTDPLNLDEALEEKSGRVSSEGRREFFRRIINSLLTLGMLLEFDLGSGLVSTCFYSHALVLLKTELSETQNNNNNNSPAASAAVEKEISNLEYCLGYNSPQQKPSSYFDRKYQAVDAEEAKARHTAVFGSYVLSQFLERNDEESKNKKDDDVFNAPIVALPIIPPLQ